MSKDTEVPGRLDSPLSEGLCSTATAGAELKAAASNAYGRGYYAGKKIRQQRRSAEAKSRHEEALWHRYMAAALTACCTAEGWTVGDKPISNIDDRTNLAADFADAALTVARRRGRL